VAKTLKVALAARRRVCDKSFGGVYDATEGIAELSMGVKIARRETVPEPRLSSVVNAAYMAVSAPFRSNVIIQEPHRPCREEVESTDIAHQCSRLPSCSDLCAHHKLVVSGLPGKSRVTQVS
jgi:hypothetical protein